MGHFTVKHKFNFNEMKLGDRVEESDFITHDAAGNVIQLQYNEDEHKIKEYIARPGIFKIQKTMAGLELVHAEFVQDQILEDLVSTAKIELCVDRFFRNIPLYKEEFGIDVPMRNMLVYGVPGTGKSTMINKAATKYAKDGRTLVMIWDTSDYEAGTVKNFISGFRYENVDKFILVAEDIGGNENATHQTRSDSALLSLLDNRQKTFTIPSMIISTTNYIGNLEGNIANRSGRFDDKVEVEYPNGESRKKLLKFFAKEHCTDDALELIASDKCKDFPPAHLKEAYIRSRLSESPLKTVINEMIEEVKLFNKNFSKNKGMGI
jgi:AAA+ superfamily predicted ATPase